MGRKSQNTINSIYGAFYRLLKENKYEDISIKDVVLTANVGRTTFYGYFSTKEQLLRQMVAYKTADMFDNARNNTALDNYANELEVTERFLSYMFREISLDFHGLSECFASPNGSLLLDIFEKDICCYITDNFCKSDAEAFEFSVNYMVSAFCDVLGWWAENGEDIGIDRVFDRYKLLTKPVFRNYVARSDADTYLTTEKRKNSINQKFKEYIHALRILSRTTDDFLFLYDIPNREIRFFGDIAEFYPINIDENGINPLDDFMRAVYPADVPSFQNEISCLENKITDTHDMKFRVVNRKKKIVWISSRGKVIYDENNEPYVMLGRLSEEALRHMYNPTTGLFNKVKLKEDLKNDFANLKEGYLMFVEIDDLTAINLSYGRKHGDEILRNLSAIMEGYSDVRKVYHVDNAIFALVLDTDTEDGAKSVFERIKLGTHSNCNFIAGAVPMDNALYIDEIGMIDSVKLTLAKARETNESEVVFFSPEEIKNSIYSVELLDELKASVENGFEGFSVNYQPQLLSGNYRLYGAESLMRYNSKNTGPVSPLQFIPLLEQSGLINEVGMWMLEQAIVACKKWQKYMPTFHISVNFSTVQFRDNAICDKILNLLEKHKLSGQSLSIEITESIPFSELGRFNTISKQLKSEGIQISIDDFGTGYSNLVYLKEFDIDEIKIDRMFIKGIEENTYNYNLISNTIEFAKANSIRICCEGVETVNELTVLETLSSDLFQGYLFERPCTPEDFEQIYFDKDNIKYKTQLNLIKEIYEYKERKGFVRFNPIDILRDTGVGLWILRINPQTGKKELHVDETMENLLGIDKKYFPEECYDYWYDRISSKYVDYVSDNFELMTEKTNGVQLEYKWLHPEKGEVTVRSTGRRGKDIDGMIVIEGYHRIFTEIEEV